MLHGYVKLNSYELRIPESSWIQNKKECQNWDSEGSVPDFQGSRNFSDGWLAHWSGGGGGADGVAVYALAALICLVRGQRQRQSKELQRTRRIG